MDSFANLIGQPQAVELLEQAIAKQRLAPAYLFAGVAGVGKKLAAQGFGQRLMALGLESNQQSLIHQKLAAGNHPDLLWVEPTYQHQGQLLTAKEAETAGLKRKTPPQIRVEQIRDITRFLSRPPLEASRSVVVIEEAQTMAESAANALLKTLEEPGRAVLILIAPSVESLLPTLVSRCQRIPFYRLSEDDLRRVLTITQHQDIISHEEICAIAQGSPGEAMFSWQQLQLIPDDLRDKIKKLPNNIRQALVIANEISQTLDSETQLWLVDYLQHCYWQQLRKPEIIEQLEQTRKFLLGYVQSRLVWETTLMKLSQMRG